MRRIVALALAALAVRVQVLAHQVHAAHVLRLGNVLQLARRDIPATAGKGLGKRLFLPKLRANRAKLPSHYVIPVTAPEIVYTGDMLVLIHRHNAATALHLLQERFFLYSVARQLYAVCVTPLVDRLHKVFDKQAAAQAIIIVAVFAVAVVLVKEGGHIVKKIVAVGLIKLISQGKRIGGMRTAVLRLVGKEAGHDRAKIRRIDLCLVFFVRFLDKFLGRVPPHRVYVGRGNDLTDYVVFGNAVLCLGHAARAVALANVNGDHVLARGELRLAGTEDAAQEKLLAVKQLAARKTARPAVLIISPRFHPQFFCLVHAGTDAVEPILAQIFGFKPAARVHKKAAHTDLVHITDLRAQLLFLKAVVPAPEGKRTKARRLCFYLIQQFLQLSNLPNNYSFVIIQDFYALFNKFCTFLCVFCTFPYLTEGAYFGKIK